MGAYNPPDQVLFSPVSNYYKGKAIRQELASGELDNKIKQANLDSAPAAAAAAARKEQREIDKETRLQEKAQREVDDAFSKGQEKELEQVGEGLAAYTISREKGADPKEAYAQLKTHLASFLPEKSVNEALATYDKNGNGFLEPEEELQLKSYAIAIGSKLGDSGAESRSARYKQAVDGGLKPGTPEFNEFVLNKGGDSGRQRDDEIASAEAIFTQGGNPDPHTAAVKFVDKGKQVLVSPTDNTVFEYDKFTEKLTIMKPEDTRGAEPEIPQEQTLYALADEATGIGPGAKAAAAKGLGPLGGYTAEATTTAKAQFLASENSLIEAFRLNPRYPQSEIKRIQSNIDIMPKFWDSAEQMRARMAGSRTFLETELASVEWNLQNPTITAKERSEEETTRRGIKRYLRVLGKPPEDISAEAVKANEGKLASIAEQIAEIDRQIEANKRAEQEAAQRGE